jgi:PPP family 3-phenylpropionic acid transporter
MVLLFGVTVLFISHNILNNYIFQIVQFHGAGSEEMGRVGALSAIVELPAMFLFFYMNKIISAGNLIKISGLFFTLKAFLTFSATSMSMIYIAQLAQGLGFALFIIASVFYVNQKIAECDKVKGQAYMTVTNTAGSVFGSLLGGWLIDTTNIPVTLLIATLTGLIGTVIVLFSSDGRR